MLTKGKMINNTW